MKTRQAIGALSAGLLMSMTSGCGVGLFCGGSEGFECPGDLFCRFSNGSCGESGLPGICMAPPDACTQVFAPVCGCDGETYPNECEAFMAGVSIAHDGACSGASCGGIAGAACGEGEFCKLPDGMCCCDIEGVCTEIPDFCTEEFDPVCGCDGETYANECEASAAGVSVDTEGECSNGGPG